MLRILFAAFALQREVLDPQEIFALKDCQMA